MKEKQVKPGEIYIVSTPIGHLDDITLRAREVLCQVDLICAEDTRHSGRLLEALDSKVPMMALHEHNEAQKADVIIEKLALGQSLALISDAGTPLISDPGFVLVNAVIGAGYKVVPVPGVSAVVTALSVAGLPTDRWLFEGFLPSKAGARVKRLEALANQPCSVVFYESSHRIEKSLADMSMVLGADRPIAVARELTKTFETVLRGTVAEILEQVSSDANQQKGEFVVVVGGKVEQAESTISDPTVLALARELSEALPPKKAAAILAKVFEGHKRDYYNLILSFNSD
ncbi:16S rRNA (cytidine(1402)-2'-O)-methyltransferase [Reinekea forsetii]|nr:16S rRNA (cytidine(1402)-2'-O)-methyltransferase [Reinekea forsetii]